MLSPFNSTGQVAPGTEIGIPLRDRPPGWLVEATEFQTFPDAVYPWDPTIVKRCQEIDPRLRPMWVKLVFKRPVDDSRGWEWKIFGRHALGLRVDNPSSNRPKLPLLRGFKDKSPPNMVLEILEDNRPWKKEEDQGDLPGKYMHFGWYIFQGVRKLYVDTNTKADAPDKEALLQKREDQKTATQKFWREFHEDVSEFKQTYVQKIIDKQSESDAQRWLKANAAGATGPDLKQYAFLGS